MANIKSQIKRNRQNDKQRLRNRVYRGEARIAVRNARNTIEEGTPESKAALQEAISALDKAAEQGVIHKNNAARRKSRLMKAFAKMEPVKVEAVPATLEPGLETEPVKKKKPAARKAAASPKGKKVVEPKAETAEEPKTEPKKTTAKSASKAKKPAVKKAVTKKPETTAKKTTTSKKPAAKK